MRERDVMPATSRPPPLLGRLDLVAFATLWPASQWRSSTCAITGQANFCASRSVSPTWSS